MFVLCLGWLSFDVLDILSLCWRVGEIGAFAGRMFGQG